MKCRAMWLVVAAVLVFSVCLPVQAEWRAHVIYCAAAAPDYDLVNGYDSSGNLLYSTQVGNGPSVSSSMIGNAIELNPNTGQLLAGHWESNSKARDTWLMDGATGAILAQQGGYITAALAFNPSNGHFYQAARWDSGSIQRGIWDIGPAGVLGSGAGEVVTDWWSWNDIAWGPDGNIYASYGNSDIAVFNGTSGALINANFITGGSSFRGIEWRGNVLYVAEMGTSSIQMYDTGGSSLGAFVASGAGGLMRPFKFDFTPDGGMLVCDYYHSDSLGGYVKQYDNTGASMGDFTTVRPAGLAAWGQGFAWPRDVAVEEFTPPNTDFTAYCIWSHATPGLLDEIWALDGSGATIWKNWDQIAADHAPLALDYNPDNQLLYVGYWDGSRYQSFDTSSNLVYTSGNVGHQVQDVEIGPDGNLYLCLSGSQGVDKWDPATNTKIGDFTPETNTLRIAWGPDGNLYARMSTTTVAKYDGTTGALLDGSFITSGLTKGSHMKWYNGDLYIGDLGPGGWTDPDGAVRRFDSSGNYLGDFVAPGAGGLLSPQGFDFTPDGGIIVADYYGGSGTPLAFRRYDSSGDSLGDFNQEAPAGAWGDPPTGWAQDIVVVPFSTPAGATVIVVQ